MNSKVLLHLSLIPGVGPITCKKIVQAWFACNEISSLCEHSVRGVKDLAPLYSFSVHDCIAKLHLREREAQLVVDGLRSQLLLEKELKNIEKESCHVITWFDKTYPALLAHTYAPPPVLYVQGSVEALSCEKTIAVVGSRKANSYAAEVTTMLVDELVDQEWIVVSGGAIGVDTLAHQTAVEKNAKTIVVLGSGLRYLYPYENKKLFNAIISSGGALVSSFAIATKPHPTHFPERNRIIAGLSKACLVTAAAEKSGALISAHYALEEGRSVFAVPGPITNSLSVGCHALIKQGAKLVHSAHDIFEEFGEVHEKKLTQLRAQENSVTVHPLIELLKEPLSLDELNIKTGISFPELQEQLFDLQLQGKVQQNFTGLWEQA